MSKSNTYRLKKWYPSLPDPWKKKEGELIVTLSGSFFDAFDGTPTLEQDEVRNNPEFWEEVPKNTYEILSFKGISGTIYKKSGDEYIGVKVSLYLEDALDKKNLHIHSVKRFSDGEVFTIGDTITMDLITVNKTIEKFKITSTGNIKAEGKNPRGRTGWSFLIDSIDKIKEPLFTTEDGVEVYKEDEVWMVLKSKYIVIGSKEADEKTGKDPTVLYFSAEDKAYSHREENRPIYSRKDIKNALKESMGGPPLDITFKPYKFKDLLNL